jgi:hypothetical protein
MNALAGHSSNRNNNVLKTAFSKADAQAWEDRILEFALQAHSSRSHYNTLCELALYLRDENCILIQWKYTPAIMECRQNSYMKVADFIVRSNLPHRTFSLSYCHNGQELLLDESAKPSLVLYWLNRLAADNAGRYHTSDDMPQRA